MKKELLLLIILLWGAGVELGYSQSTFISGRVSSADDGEPIIGASIVIKGTGSGTITDFDGNFAIEVPENNSILVFSYVGMTTVEAPAQNGMQIRLETASEALEELVVVAYGTAKKSSLTGSVTSIGAKKMAKSQVADAAKALEGSVPGLTISGTGQPGTGSNIQIRGIGSINASNYPLIIVDGAPYEGSLSSINTADIESMNVLKDAASAALYGARGANGVIIITSKRGKSGKTNVSFDMRIGGNYRGVPEYDIMRSPAAYYETMWEALYNRHYHGQGLKEQPIEERALLARQFASSAGEQGITGLYDALGYNIYDVANNQIVLENGKLNPNAKLRYKDANFNDWLGALYKPQLRQEYNLSLSKGNDDTKIFFSLGYLDDKGYNINSGFSRMSSRLAIDTKVTDWFNLKSSSNFSHSNADRTAGGASFINTFQWTRSIAPIYPIYEINKEGEYVYNTKGEKIYDMGIPSENHRGRPYGENISPVATQMLNSMNSKNYYLTQNINTDISLPYGFSFSTNSSVYANWSQSNSYDTPEYGDAAIAGGIGNKTHHETITLDFNQILRWEKKFDLLFINVLLGHEYHHRNYNNLYGSKRRFLDPENSEFDNAAEISKLGSYRQDYKLEGFFGQITMDHADKYYLSGSLRSDASSVFHPEHRRGTFWSVGTSWRINQEDFLKDVKQIDNLKLKVSYGLQGNDHLFLPTGSRSYTPYKTLYEVTSDGETGVLTPRFLGNKKVSWEKNYNFNAGAEFSLFNGLLMGEFEYFRRKTKDLLFNVPVSASTGFSSRPENVGDMLNEGVELSLNSNIINKAHLSWSVGVNFSHYNNIVTRLPENFRKDGISKGVQRIMEGGSIYDFYLVKYAGVNTENGDAQYMLKNEEGKFVKSPSEEYKSEHNEQKAGNSLPKLYGGFNTELKIHNFDLSMQFAYRIGGYILDYQYTILMNSGKAGNNWHNDILNRWTPENKNSNIPRVQTENNKLVAMSDRFLTDASFISFKNLTFGYTFESNSIKKLNLSHLRVYLTAENLFFFSQRKGMDPRVNFEGINGSATYSPARTVSLGLLVNL